MFHKAISRDGSNQFSAALLSQIEEFEADQHQDDDEFLEKVKEENSKLKNINMDDPREIFNALLQKVGTSKVLVHLFL